MYPVCNPNSRFLWVIPLSVMVTDAVRIVVGKIYDCCSTIGIGGGSNDDSAVLKLN